MLVCLFIRPFICADERTIGQGIIAQCHINGLNPYQESDRIKAANDIADMADSIVGSIGRFQWDIAVTRIGQLASEMILSTGLKSHTSPSILV